ncbi:MAG: VanW family protein [Niastella sp.]|nr:VanW family protein [Niastella sp.]
MLLKKLGDSDKQLQINKVTNLKIAAKKIDGILIRPGETFSFCKLVGLPTKRKGYLLGMELSFGERYHHSFDPFPDDGRVLPFGSGATVFYNYRDYQFTNNTSHTFQVNLWFSDKCLEGELRIDTELDYAYHVMEKDHQFLKIEGQFYRKNEIWREKILKFKSGQVVETELITKNFARVTYTPDNYIAQKLQTIENIPS